MIFTAIRLSIMKRLWKHIQSLSTWVWSYEVRNGAAGLVIGTLLLWMIGVMWSALRALALNAWNRLPTIIGWLTSPRAVTPGEILGFLGVLLLAMAGFYCWRRSEHRRHISELKVENKQLKTDAEAREARRRLQERLQSGATNFAHDPPKSTPSPNSTSATIDSHPVWPSLDGPEIALLQALANCGSTKLSVEKLAHYLRLDLLFVGAAAVHLERRTGLIRIDTEGLVSLTPKGSRYVFGKRPA